MTQSGFDDKGNSQDTRDQEKRESEDGILEGNGTEMIIEKNMRQMKLTTTQQAMTMLSEHL